jgi:Arc/MetJ family transcription regulator
MELGAIKREQGGASGLASNDVIIDAIEMCASNLASNDAIIGERVRRMRTTLNLDEGLVATAQRYTGIEGKSDIVREGLKALVEREAMRRLAKLGGSSPDLEAVPRRRFDAEDWADTKARRPEDEN